MSIKKPHLLGLSSLVLLLFAWPPSSFSPLLFLAYSPIIYAFFKYKSTERSFLLIYFFYFLFLGINNAGLFIEGYDLTALITCLFVVPLFWSIPFLISKLLAIKTTHRTGILSLPILFFLQEQFQYHWELSFIWYHLSYSLGDIEMFSGLYPLIGLSGMSFMIIATNTLFAYVFLSRSSFMNKGLISLTLIAIIALSTFLSKGYDLSKTEVEKSMEIAVFSPSTEDLEAVRDDLRGQIDLLINYLSKNSFNGANLIVGPEGFLSDVNDFPLFIDQLDSLGAIKELKDISKKYNTPILLGAILVDRINADHYPSSTAKLGSQGQYFEIYNGSVLIQAGKKTEWRTKQKLLPIAESVPFSFILNQEWMPFGRFDNGYGIVSPSLPYRINGHVIGTSICYESLYPDFINSWNLKEVDIHLILSNDFTINQNTLEQQAIYSAAVSKSFQLRTILVGMNKSSYYIDGKKQMYKLSGSDVYKLILN